MPFAISVLRKFLRKIHTKNLLHFRHFQRNETGDRGTVSKCITFSEHTKMVGIGDVGFESMESLLYFSDCESMFSICFHEPNVVAQLTHTQIARAHAHN